MYQAFRGFANVTDVAKAYLKGKIRWKNGRWNSSNESKNYQFIRRDFLKLSVDPGL